MGLLLSLFTEESTPKEESVHLSPPWFVACSGCIDSWRCHVGWGVGHWRSPKHTPGKQEEWCFGVGQCLWEDGSLALLCLYRFLFLLGTGFRCWSSVHVKNSLDELWSPDYQFRSTGTAFFFFGKVKFAPRTITKVQFWTFNSELDTMFVIQLSKMDKFGSYGGFLFCENKKYSNLNKKIINNLFK